MENANGGMGGKVVLVTGGTSGIGKATATALASMGAETIVTGRNREKGERAAEEIRRDSGGKVDLALADLSSQEEVRWLAGEFRERYDRLDVLVNNAGAIFTKRRETPAGIEMTLALNHLAPFLLTNLLLDVLQESAPSRVVTVASQAQNAGTKDFFDLQSENGYKGFQVYGKTKLANIMFTFELAERLRGTGVTAVCVHPGGVNTEFGNNNDGPFGLMFRVMKPFMRSPEQGADTVIYAAIAPEIEGMTGAYLADRKPITASDLAYDAAARKRLWEESERLTGLMVAS